jgi:hypothetical protein
MSELTQLEQLTPNNDFPSLGGPQNEDVRVETNGIDVGQNSGKSRRYTRKQYSKFDHSIQVAEPVSGTYSGHINIACELENNAEALALANEALVSERNAKAAKAKEASDKNTARQLQDNANAKALADTESSSNKLLDYTIKAQNHMSEYIVYYDKDKNLRSPEDNQNAVNTMKNLRSCLIQIHIMKNELLTRQEKIDANSTRKHIYDIPVTNSIFRILFFREIDLFSNKIHSEEGTLPDGIKSFTGCIKYVCIGQNKGNYVMSDCANPYNKNAIEKFFQSDIYNEHVICGINIYRDIRCTKITEEQCNFIARFFVVCLYDVKDDDYYLNIDSGIIVKLCQFFTERSRLPTKRGYDFCGAVENISKQMKNGFKHNSQRLKDFYLALIIVSFRINWRHRELFNTNVFESFNKFDKETLKGFEAYI